MNEQLDEPDYVYIASKLAEALDFWLPPDEPYDPHTTNKIYQFKNDKWKQACDALRAFKEAR